MTREQLDSWGAFGVDALNVMQAHVASLDPADPLLPVWRRTVTRAQELGALFRYLALRTETQDLKDRRDALIVEMNTLKTALGL